MTHDFGDTLAASPTTALLAWNEWLDMNTRWFEDWAQWQQAFWQPLVDREAGWMACWQEALGAPGAERGTEQLA